MVDRTPTNNLSIKMRARRLEQQMKKRDNRYSSKESKQTIAPRDPMKKRGKSYAPNEDMRVVRPYAASCQFIFEFGIKDRVQLKCSKISNLELEQAIEEYVEGGNPQPHFFTTGKSRSDTLRIERAVVVDKCINKLKPGIRIRNGAIWIYQGDKGYDGEYVTMNFGEGIITKCQFSNLDAMGSSIFIQTLEITHTGLVYNVE